VAYEIPREKAPEINYEAAVMAEGRSPDAAVKFLKHLQSAGATETFVRFGFIVNSAVLESNGKR